MEIILLSIRFLTEFSDIYELLEAGGQVIVCGDVAETIEMHFFIHSKAVFHEEEDMPHGSRPRRNVQRPIDEDMGN